MSFIESPFLCFLAVFILVYYLLPARYRYLVLLGGSLFFYGYHDPTVLFTLLLITIITYFGGRAIYRRKTKTVFRVFFFLNLGILFLLKYLVFTMNSMNQLFSMIHWQFTLPRINLVAPVGLSFYVFQSTTYLNDIYRKNQKPEKNFLKYATFVSFFPVILSGPIQKSRDLLPQINSTNKPFSSDDFMRGLILFIWGYCERVLVSTRLQLIVDNCWSNLSDSSGIYPIIAAIAFSFYIYCDFSAYSDMACGVAGLLGFHIEGNFRNPYLATSISDFWGRWHTSLNNWFLENVYIPLGGSRKGKLRKYLNVMTVFLFSGAWHGASIVWGGVNGLLHIVEAMLTPIRDRLFKRLNINDSCFSIRVLNRTMVFVIITITWVFFRAPNMIDAGQMLSNMGSVRFIDLFDPDILRICGTEVDTFFCLLWIAVFLNVQYYRRNGNRYYAAFRAQPVFFQVLSIGVVIYVLVMVSLSGKSDVNTAFIYFQF